MYLQPRVCNQLINSTLSGSPHANNEDGPLNIGRSLGVLGLVSRLYRVCSNGADVDI
jgi:hypothetical protein